MKWKYGSNTAHHLRERRQRFLLATQGAAACWAIHWSIKKFQYSLPYLKAYYFNSSYHVSYESPFFIISYKTPFTAFFVEVWAGKGSYACDLFVNLYSQLAVRERPLHDIKGVWEGGIEEDTQTWWRRSGRRTEEIVHWEAS